jgi:hypothetical protein
MAMLVLLVLFVLAAWAVGDRYPRVGIGMGLGAIVLSVATLVSVALFGSDGT